MAEAPVYLDYNATAPIRPAAAAAAAEALTLGGNPSSVHGPGRRARALVEDARAAVAAVVGMPPEAVVFTSGGTEANNLAILGGAGADRPSRRLVISAIEHDSVRAAAAAAGAPLCSVAVEGSGRLSLADLDHALASDPRPALVSLMLVNNETGVVQPVAEATAIGRRHGALVHCDAAQAAGGSL